MKIYCTVMMLLLFAGVGLACTDYISMAQSAAAAEEYSSAAGYYESAAECYSGEGRDRLAAQNYDLAAEHWVFAGESLDAAQNYMAAASYYRTTAPASCGESAEKAAALYRAQNEISSEIASYSTALSCYRLANRNREAFSSAYSAAQASVRNQEYSSAINYFDAAIAHGTEARLRAELCPVYEELGDALAVSPMTHYRESAGNYSLAGECYKQARDSSSCESALLKAIEMAEPRSSMLAARYYSEAGLCYGDSRIFVEITKCGYYLGTSANIYENFNSYNLAGEAYRKTAECYSRSTDQTAKNLEREHYYSCAQNYIKHSMNQQLISAVETLSKARECYSSAGANAHRDLITEYIYTMQYSPAEAEKYDLSVLAENPRAPVSSVMITDDPHENGAPAAPEKNNTLMYAGIVVMVVVLLGASLLVLKKKPKEGDLEMPEEEEEPALPEEEEYTPF